MNYTDEVVKYQQLELVVTGTSANPSTLNRPTFTNQPFLNERYMVSLEFFSVMDLATSPLGNPLFGASVITGSYLVLYGEDPELESSQGTWLEYIPLWKLHNMNNQTDPYVRYLTRFRPRKIAWEKSYVQTAPGGTGVQVNTSFLFLVGYQGLGRNGNNS